MIIAVGWASISWTNSQHGVINKNEFYSAFICSSGISTKYYFTNSSRDSRFVMLITTGLLFKKGLAKLCRLASLTIYKSYMVLISFVVSDKRLQEIYWQLWNYKILLNSVPYAT